MKLVHNERNGEAFDSQLVIGVRESYVNLCSNPQGKCLIKKLTINCLELYIILTLGSSNDHYIAEIYYEFADKLLIYRENFERAYIEATEQFYSVKAPEQLGIGISENEGHGVYAYMRYAESKLREEEQRAQKYLETSLCTTAVNTSIQISAGPVHSHTTQQPISSNTSTGIGSQQPVITNGGGVIAAGIGTANGLNSTSTSGSVQNLVDSCVVS